MRVFKCLFALVPLLLLFGLARAVETSNIVPNCTITTDSTVKTIESLFEQFRWDTNDDGGYYCWYNSSWTCLDLAMSGYGTTQSDIIYNNGNNASLGITSGSDYLNVTCSGASHLLFQNKVSTATVTLTGDANFTADYAYIKGIASYGSGDNDIDSDNAKTGLVLWDESEDIAIAIQPSQKDTGDWGADFDGNAYEVDLAINEYFTIMALHGMDVTTNTDCGIELSDWSDCNTAVGDEETLEITYDDFEDDVVNTNLWTAPQPKCNEFDGNLSCDTGGSGYGFNAFKLNYTNGVHVRVLAITSGQLCNGCRFDISRDNTAVFGITGSGGKAQCKMRNTTHESIDDTLTDTVMDSWHVYDFYLNNTDETAQLFVDDNLECDYDMNDWNPDGIGHFTNNTLKLLFVSSGHNITFNHVNVTIDVIPNSVDNDNSASWNNVTQTASFTESWSNASLRQTKIIRSISDITVTDTYSYTNLTNDFITFDGVKDNAPYCAYLPINTSGNTNSWNYVMPSYYGDFYFNMSTTQYTTVTYIYPVLELAITSPTNATYMTTGLTLTYLPNTTYPSANNVNCTVLFDGVNNNTYTDTNNTARSFDFTQSIPTFHNVSVNCYDGNVNTTATTYFTVGDVNFTLTQNATAYEGTTNLYTVDIGLNPDIISYVNASLNWNNTYIGYNEIANTSPSNTRANMTFTLPITVTNNTSINTYWNVTKQYINSSAYTENSDASAQACLYAWNWSSTTYTDNLLERSLNDISVNISKLGGVSDPLNTSILVLLNYNGSPTTMPNTMNTSTKLGYSNTTRVPRIPAGYNWTFGFNATINYSINHGVLGYNSRIDNIASTNNTQTVHKLILTNCTTGKEALKLRFFDEFNPGTAVNSSVDSYIEIFLADGTNRSYGFELTNDETFGICIEPYFASFRANGGFTYGGASIDADYTYREYYLVNASINNVSNNIDLYTLATANGTALTFSLVDEFGAKIEGVVVKALRWYPLLTGYKTVNMGKSNFDGDAVLNLKFSDTYYKFLFEQNGTVVKEISKLIIYSTPLSVSIAEILDTYYTILDNVAYNHSSTNVSDIITWGITVTDTSGLMISVNLKCVKKSLLGDTVINDTTITGSAVTIYCVLGNYSNNVFYITATGTFSDYGTLTIYSDTFDWSEPYAYGVSGLFASFMIIGSLMFIGLWSPGASIILGIIGLILTNALGFIDLAISNIIGLIIVGVLIILMRRRNS